MKFSAVLLAGGESRRMGTDKATLIYEGEPLWQRQIRTLRELRPEKLFVSARVKPAWLPGDAEFVMDEAPPRGPLSGITAAISQMETSHLITLAVDMPFIAIEDLLSLVRLAKTTRGVVPMIDDRAEALAAIYPKEAHASCISALSSSDSSLQRLVGELAQSGLIELTYLSQLESRRYLSINTPEDLDATLSQRLRRVAVATIG